MKTFTFILLAVVAALSTEVLHAQRTAVPANLQAAIFKKILGFDKTLQLKGKIEVAMVYGDASVKDAIIEAFKDLGISAVPLKSDLASANLGGASVVYVAPGATAPRQLCIRDGILSISGVASFVEKGQVSIGISVEGGKPKILIHKGQLKSEGHELSEDILAMARIVD